MLSIYSFYFLNKFTFFYAIFIGIMKINNINPLQISAVIVVQELIKVMASSYTGALADKYGIRKIMTTGLIIQVIGLFLWFFAQNFIQFAVAISIIGLARSCILGKIDAFVYNSLLSIGKDSKFRNVLLVATIIESFASVCVGIIVKIIGNYSILSAFSIFIIVGIQIPFILIIMKDPLIIAKKYIKETPFQIIKIAKNIVYNNKQILYFTILSALPTSIMMLSSDLYKMIITDLDISVSDLGQIYAFAHFLPAVMSLIFLFIKRLNINHAIGIILCGMISFIFASVFYSKISILIIVIFIGFLPICNSLFRNALEASISSDIRATVTSFVSLITAFINVVGLLLIGIIATFYSYKISICFIALMFSFIIIILFSSSFRLRIVGSI
jgi:MFS family permease